jgi:hypothetical protein
MIAHIKNKIRDKYVSIVSTPLQWAVVVILVAIMLKLTMAGHVVLSIGSYLVIVYCELQFKLFTRMEDSLLKQLKEFCKQGDAHDIPLRPIEAVLRFIPERSREHLIGDLEEEYRTIILPQRGQKLAQCWYLYQVINIIRAYSCQRFRRLIGIEKVRKLIGK